VTRCFDLLINLCKVEFVRLNLFKERIVSDVFVIIHRKYTEIMSCPVLLDNKAKPKSMSRAKQWTGEVENLYRFQQAGYRDELEYRQIQQVEVTLTSFCYFITLLLIIMFTQSL